MYREDEYIALSALQHLVFCPRQCALNYIERTWVENKSSAEGRSFHSTVEGGPDEARDDVLVFRSLDLSSENLGVFGVSDVVEFHRYIDKDSTSVYLTGKEGRWRPYPVEYKRGHPKAHDADMVQLCAQAICLEEMLDVEIQAGALFYGEIRRRQEVQLSLSLRNRTEALARQLHAMYRGDESPPSIPGEKCRYCSMNTVCMPNITAKKSWKAYYKEVGDEASP